MCIRDSRYYSLICVFYLLYFIRMKKFLLILISFFSLFLFSNVFAASWQISKWILFKFCDDGVEQDKLKSDFNILTKPWEKQNVCLLFYNSNPNTLSFTYWFSESIINSANHQLCDSDIGTGNDFSKMFINEKERIYTLKPWESIVINESFIPPLGMNGAQYWCLAHMLIDKTETSWMFKIVKRNANLMKIFVWGESIIKNSVDFASVSSEFMSLNNKIWYTYSWNMLKISFAVTNNWNVTQSINISGMVYNVLGFQKDFSIVSRNIAPGETAIFSADVGIIPFYKWLFSVLINLDASPVYEFDVSGLDKKLLEHTVLQEIGSIFIFSWAWVIVFVAVLWIIVKLFWPKKKNIIA